MLGAWFYEATRKGYGQPRICPGTRLSLYSSYRSSMSRTKPSDYALGIMPPPHAFPLYLHQLIREETVIQSSWLRSDTSFVFSAANVMTAQHAVNSWCVFFFLEEIWVLFYSFKAKQMIKEYYLSHQNWDSMDLSPKHPFAFWVVVVWMRMAPISS